MSTEMLIRSLVFIGFLLCPCQSDPWDMVPEILSRIKEPQIPSNRICNILNFGAIKSADDSSVDETSEIVDTNTDAFRNAIQSCHDEGGGTVVVPSGTFLTSPITLLSNVALNVTSGSIIRFTRDVTKYPNVFTRWEGVELINYSPFIYSYKSENISITGKGIIDGNSDCNHWWPWKGEWTDLHRLCWDENGVNQSNDRARLFQMAEDKVPVDQRIFGVGHYLRPQFIQPYECKNVLIEGVTLIHSPMWVVHPVLCENVIIRNINITSLGPNSDGIDPESSKDVLIEGVYFNSGDDDIAIKSGRNEDGRRLGRATENIIIRNCSMLDGHGGVTLGSECSGGIRNVFAENCILDSPNLNTAFRVKNNSLRGGLLQNFNVRNMRVGQVAQQVIEVDFYYEEGSNAAFIPILRNFTIENVDVRGSAPKSLVVKGYPVEGKSYIDITLRNISFSGIMDDPHFVLENVNYVWATDVTINGEEWNDVPFNEAPSSGVVANATKPATLCLLLIFTIFSKITNLIYSQ